MMPASAGRKALCCRVVFLEQVPGAVVLDCVTTRGHHTGAPFTIKVEAPLREWMGAAVAVLERWASEGRELGFQFRAGGRCPQVEVSDGCTRMVLDVEFAGAG